MNTPYEVTQLGERLGGGPAGLGEQLSGLGRVLLDEDVDGPQVHPHGDQSRLRPVVQVPLDTAEFGRRGVHGGAPGLGEDADPLGEFAAAGGEDGAGEEEMDPKEGGERA